MDGCAGRRWDRCPCWQCFELPRLRHLNVSRGILDYWCYHIAVGTQTVMPDSAVDLVHVMIRVEEPLTWWLAYQFPWGYTSLPLHCQSPSRPRAVPNCFNSAEGWSAISSFWLFECEPNRCDGFDPSACILWACILWACISWAVQLVKREVRVWEITRSNLSYPHPHNTQYTHDTGPIYPTHTP